MPSSAAQGFPRQARLTRATEFERVLRRPDFTLRSGPLRLNAVFNRMPTARIGLVVGRKAVPRAHARNLIKRIIRDRFRLERKHMAALDLVVRVVGPIDRAELHRCLGELFQGVADKAQSGEPASNEQATT